jgi:hypothetical protein
MKYSIALLALVLVLSFPACDGTEEPSLTPSEETQALLTGTGSTPKSWKMQTVKVDGTDQSSLFTGMTIAFGKGTFTVTGGGPVWPSSGTFTINDAGTTIKRSDGVDVTVVVTETKLTLTMAWTKKTFGPGRTASVAGQHVFEFTS